MKATVDQDACIGCELCTEVCGAVFQMDGDVAKTIVDEVPADAEQDCRQAADNCPVDAISVEE